MGWIDKAEARLKKGSALTSDISRLIIEARKMERVQATVESAATENDRPDLELIDTLLNIIEGQPK